MCNSDLNEFLSLLFVSLVAFGFIEMQRNIFEMIDSQPILRMVILEINNYQFLKNVLCFLTGDISSCENSETSDQRL